MAKRPIALHTITRYDAEHLMWVMRIPGGVNPGGFTEKLIEAALVADEHNLERLERGFEGLISAIRVYKGLPGGTQILAKIAAGEPLGDLHPVT